MKSSRWSIETPATIVLGAITASTLIVLSTVSQSRGVARALNDSELSGARSFRFLKAVTKM